MTIFSDWELIAGLKSRDPKAIEQVYTAFHGSVKSFVLQNSGGEEDADDLFQETVIIIFKQVREGRRIDCSLNTYFISVARLLWYKELRRRKRYHRGTAHEDLLVNLEDYSPGVSGMMEHAEMQRIYLKAFDRIGDDCRRILRMFYEKVSLREIASRMGYASEKYAKKRKFMCKEKLIRIIEADPAYIEWIADE